MWTTCRSRSWMPCKRSSTTTTGRSRRPRSPTSRSAPPTRSPGCPRSSWTRSRRISSSSTCASRTRSTPSHCQSDAMNIEERLNHVADRYRGRGYRVIVRPGPNDLPPFAKDFELEVLATRADGNVLASVKGSPSDMQADPNLSKYAEVIEKQPGWRYDVFVVGPDP